MGLHLPGHIDLIVLAGDRTLQPAGGGGKPAEGYLLEGQFSISGCFGQPGILICAANQGN